MPNNKYISGRGLEYRVMNLLRNLGEYPVRSAGSHSYFDVISFSSNGVKLIQCKSFKKHGSIESLKKEVAKDFDYFLKNYDYELVSDNRYFLVIRTGRTLQGFEYNYHSWLTWLL
jgi:Holliday junction resolvase